MSAGNGYAGRLRSKQGPILQCSVGAFGTGGFTVCKKEAMMDFKGCDPIVVLL